MAIQWYSILFGTMRVNSLVLRHMNKPALYLYGRETCHLCHDMWADLRVYCVQNQLDFELIWVDIEEIPEYKTQYEMRIPVLTNAGHRVLCEGRLDTTKLTKALIRQP